MTGGLEKIESLFKMDKGDLLDIPLAQWNEMFSDVHDGDLKLIANRLREMAVRAVRMAAYIDTRGGEGGMDKGHKAAVKAQNEQAEKIRALLDYQNPKEILNF